MKTSLDHLPPHKRDNLRAVTRLLCSRAPIEVLILFGSYARGDWVEDVENLYFSDYDLLAIVRKAGVARDDALWSQLQADASAITGRVPVSLIAHDLKDINHQIRAGRYFFVDILQEGVELFRDERTRLSAPRAPTSAERLEMAREYFLQWYTTATGFWETSMYCVQRGQLANAAFILHQAAERYFHAVTLVFTGYKKKTHDLEWLASHTAVMHELLAGALPRKTPADKGLFDLLKRAYIEARYSMTYVMTEEQHRILHERVAELGRRARQACAEEMARFAGAEAVGELPSEPVLGDMGALPPLPARMDDARAVERWRDAIVQLSEARAEARGREAGRREEQARAILDVLLRRGVAVSDDEAAQILACRDAARLARWQDAAWQVGSAGELLGR